MIHSTDQNQRRKSLKTRSVVKESIKMTMIFLFLKNRLLFQI